MSDKNLNDYVAIYQKLVVAGDVQVAYEALLKYMMALKAHFHKEWGKQYVFGNVSPGYMDFSYFPFSDGFLRERMLRFSVVLNHKEMCFEVWLMGRNAEVQARYWEVLKGAVWNEHRTTMPKYSVLECVVVEKPDFSDLEKLSKEIEKCAMRLAEEVCEWLQQRC